MKRNDSYAVSRQEKFYGDPNTKNMLIHGDNLLSLKALEQEYAGKVKRIYSDPPYNTGNAFEHYDDGPEHSIWLNLIRSLIELLKNLLSDVQDKAKAAIQYCRYATEYNLEYGEKPWKYAIIPHDKVSMQMGFMTPVRRYEVVRE